MNSPEEAQKAIEALNGSQLAVALSRQCCQAREERPAGAAVVVNTAAAVAAAVAVATNRA